AGSPYFLTDLSVAKKQHLRRITIRLCVVGACVMDSSGEWIGRGVALVREKSGLWSDGLAVRNQFADWWFARGETHRLLKNWEIDQVRTPNTLEPVTRRSL